MTFLELNMMTQIRLSHSGETNISNHIVCVFPFLGNMLRLYTMSLNITLTFLPTPQATYTVQCEVTTIDLKNPTDPE